MGDLVNTEWEGYADGRVSLSSSRAGGEGGSTDLLPGDDENGGKRAADISYSLGYCNDNSIRAAHDGVWLELGTHHIWGEEKINYSVTVEARLTWRQAAQLHDYLGMLLRQVPHRPQGDEPAVGH